MAPCKNLVSMQLEANVSTATPTLTLSHSSSSSLNVCEGWRALCHGADSHLNTTNTLQHTCNEKFKQSVQSQDVEPNFVKTHIILVSVLVEILKFPETSNAASCSLWKRVDKDAQETSGMSEFDGEEAWV